MNKMKTNVLVSLIVAFAIMTMVAFLGINWVSTIDPPSNVTSDEYAQYTNLTDTVDIAHTGQEGVILLVIVSMILVAIILLAALATKI